MTLSFELHVLLDGRPSLAAAGSDYGGAWAHVRLCSQWAPRNVRCAQQAVKTWSVFHAKHRLNSEVPLLCALDSHWRLVSEGRGHLEDQHQEAPVVELVALLAGKEVATKCVLLSLVELGRAAARVAAEVELAARVAGKAVETKDETRVSEKGETPRHPHQARETAVAAKSVMLTDPQHVFETKVVAKAEKLEDRQLVCLAHHPRGASTKLLSHQMACSMGG